MRRYELLVQLIKQKENAIFFLGIRNACQRPKQADISELEKHTTLAIRDIRRF